MSRPCLGCLDWIPPKRRAVPVAPGIAFTSLWGNCRRTGKPKHEDEDCDQPQGETMEEELKEAQQLLIDLWASGLNEKVWDAHDWLVAKKRTVAFLIKHGLINDPNKPEPREKEKDHA